MVSSGTGMKISWFLLMSDVLPKYLFVEKLKEFSDFTRICDKTALYLQRKMHYHLHPSRHNVCLFAAELRVFLAVTREGRLHLINFLSAR